MSIATKAGERDSPTRQDFVRVLALAERLRSLFQGARPEPDAIALGRARFFCCQMVGLDPYVDAQVTRIENLLPIFFSPLWRTGHAGEAEGMRSAFNAVLGNIRERVDALTRSVAPA
jgi:hypothetical protein